MATLIRVVQGRLVSKYKADRFLQGIDPEHLAIADDTLNEKLTEALHQMDAGGLPPDVIARA